MLLSTLSIEGHATAAFLHPTRACARRRDGREPRQSFMRRANPSYVRFVARSIERYAGDAAALGHQLLLSPQVGGDRVRCTRPLMIEIPAARSRQLVFTRGKPRLGYATLMKIIRRRRA